MSKNLVIVSFAEQTTSIYEIPFPAVTICPETKTIADKFNISATIQQMKRAKQTPLYGLSEET